jgi:hypothetical protein
MPRAPPVMAATWPVRIFGCLAIELPLSSNVTGASSYAVVDGRCQTAVR